MKHHVDEEVSEGGVFTANGSGSVVFRLRGHERPERVRVDFDGDVELVVCNPHHRDELEWDVVQTAHHHHDGHHEHRYELRVRWHVSGIRRVTWSVDG